LFVHVTRRVFNNNFVDVGGSEMILVIRVS
jgi:hypothetical protein